MAEVQQGIESSDQNELAPPGTSPDWATTDAKKLEVQQGIESSDARMSESSPAAIVCRARPSAMPVGAPLVGRKRPGREDPEPADTSRGRRKEKKMANNTVSEVYSPPRITEAARRQPGLGLTAGFALDLTTGWDFTVAERRQAARDLVRKTKPAMVIGSPMCTRFCVFQFVNDMKRSPEEVRRSHVRAMVHLRFVCEIYQEQIDGQRYFLHEHPAGATSWNERCVKNIEAQPGVGLATCDQCQYGQEYQGEPVRKPTTWMSNAEKVLQNLGERCKGRGGACSRQQGGHHRSCSGKVAKASQIYPEELCQAVLEGFRLQLIEEGRLVVGMIGMQMPEETIGGKTLDQACAAARDPMIEAERKIMPEALARMNLPKADGPRDEGYVPDSLGPEAASTPELLKIKSTQDEYRDAITGLSSRLPLDPRMPAS